jgi:HD-like signal output (HDOD) protein
MKKPTIKDKLVAKLERMGAIPSIKAILEPLLQELDQPIEQQKMSRVVELIAHDNSLAAQCLHMANSPLFGRSQTVQTVRGAVVALGLRRMRDIAISCCVLNMLPWEKMNIDPLVFWEHSLSCALITRRFAQKIKFDDPEKAYLAGLLHDIGVVLHLWLIPDEFRPVLEAAKQRQVPLHEVEREMLGFDHADSGRLLADRWNLTPELQEVVCRHHDLAMAKLNPSMVSLVNLSDLLCRMRGLGYGYLEARIVDFTEEPAVKILRETCPLLETFDWARFTFELDEYVEEVRRLVTVFYRMR